MSLNNEINKNLSQKRMTGKKLKTFDIDNVLDMETQF